MPLGIMPEIMHVVPCKSENHRPWDEQIWHNAVNKAREGPEDIETKIQENWLRPGATKIDDGRYILRLVTFIKNPFSREDWLIFDRPEAIESVFILYRITEGPTLRERAWNMFNSIIKHTVTEIAHAALDGCTVPDPLKADRMESFWVAETLKYFYLIFSEPEVVSLDEYVLKTEAHPLKRPARQPNIINDLLIPEYVT
jgi:mannosyl-oligosaccharide alpha-1,2-mannosidase